MCSCRESCEHQACSRYFMRNEAMVAELDASLSLWCLVIRKSPRTAHGIMTNDEMEPRYSESGLGHRESHARENETIMLFAGVLPVRTRAGLWRARGVSAQALRSRPRVGGPLRSGSARGSGAGGPPLARSLLHTCSSRLI